MRSEEKTVAWAGIFIVGAGLLLVAGIVVFGQRSRLFRRHYPLRAEFANVQGLDLGATVRVAGVLVGSVAKLEVPPEPDVKKVVVWMSIETAMQSKIRKDSVASIRTLGMLGDKYMEITIGTSKSARLEDGDMVQSEEPLDIYEIADEGREVVKKLNRVAASLEGILTEFQRSTTLANLDKATASLTNIVKGIEEGPGTLHTVIFDPEVADFLKNLQAASETFRQMLEKAVKTEGGLGEMLFGKEYEALGQRLRETVESVSRVVATVEKGESLLHALIYDPEERKAITQIRLAAARLDEVLQKAEAGEGTVSLLLNDPGVWEDLRRVLGGVQRSTILKFFIRQSLAEDEETVGKGQ